MSNLCEYELKRLRNIEENNKMLDSLGLLHYKFQPIRTAPARVSVPKAKQGIKRKRVVVPESSSAGSMTEFAQEAYSTQRRRSNRIQGKAPTEDNFISVDELEEFEKSPSRPRTTGIRDNVFGHISGIPVGKTWQYRMACSEDGIHRPTIAGIHGSEKAGGVYSIALSGGYEDDVDYGDCFTYTGSGGRDLKGTKNNPKNLRTAKQSKDQELSNVNLALTLNIENKQPVRVIRGFKLNNAYAPTEGYRYDGLYSVLKYWKAPGLGGFAVYKYALQRCPDQPPAPWTIEKPICLDCWEIMTTIPINITCEGCLLKETEDNDASDSGCNSEGYEEEETDRHADNNSKGCEGGPVEKKSEIIKEETEKVEIDTIKTDEKKGNSDEVSEGAVVIEKGDTESDN